MKKIFKFRHVVSKLTKWVEAYDSKEAMRKLRLEVEEVDYNQYRLFGVCEISFQKS